MDIQEKHDFVVEHIESATPAMLYEIYAGICNFCLNMTFILPKSAWIISIVDGKMPSYSIPVLTAKDDSDEGVEQRNVIELVYSILTEEDITESETEKQPEVVEVQQEKKDETASQIQVMEERLTRAEQSLGILFDRQVMLDVQNKIQRTAMDKFLKWAVDAGFDVSRDSGIYRLKVGSSMGRVVSLEPDVLWISALADVLKIKIGSLIDKLTKDLSL